MNSYEGRHVNKQIEQVTQVKYFFTMRNHEMLFPVFVQWLLLLQNNAPIHLKLQHPTPPPPGQPLKHLNFLKGQVHGIVHLWVWQYPIVFTPIGSKLDACREIYTGVFLDIWFDFICPHNSYSLLFLRYVLQPVRIKFTALSCSETNIYRRVFLWGLLHTHANTAVTSWQTKFVNKPK